MNQAQTKQLSLALQLVGVIFIVGIYLMMRFMTSAWSWEPRQPEYEQMIMGLYVVLGIFLLKASKDPVQHMSLIWFTVWSSAVHAAIMLVQALRDPAETANLYGDVPALFVVAGLLGFLASRK